MATYVNDLRLKEIATGDESGTWGASTNTNLELIAEAFSFGTEAITTNADTHTTTIADGSTDPGRSIYLKYTGTLDSACTITIGPNTVSKLWFIENGTSGSQNIIISQGSGANVTIPPGDVKVVYSDGAGSGAAITDAFASLSVVDLKVQDDLTVTDDLIVNGDIDLEGNMDVNGTLETDALSLNGTTVTSTAAEINLLDGSSANTVVNSKAVIYGSSGEVAGTLSTAAQTNITSVGTLTGLTVNGDVTLTGSSYNIVFDQSDNALEFADNAKAVFGAGSDLSRWFK
jgi:cytoskeletal protein CcmA (bactofilin family)